MTSPNRKFNAAITDSQVLEITLLKQCVLSALRGGYAMSYNDRYFLYPYEEGFVVNKAEDMAANIPFRAKQCGDAVNFFVDLFIHESNVDLAKVVFHRGDLSAVAAPWSTLKRFCGISNLLEGTVNQVVDVLTVIQVNETAE